MHGKTHPSTAAAGEVAAAWYLFQVLYLQAASNSAASTSFFLQRHPVWLQLIIVLHAAGSTGMRLHRCLILLRLGWNGGALNPHT